MDPFEATGRTSRGRRPWALGLGVLGAAILMLSAIAGIATAAGATGSRLPTTGATGGGPTCTWDGSTVTATYGNPNLGWGYSGFVFQDPSAGGELMFAQGEILDCGGTISNTTKIVVIGVGDGFGSTESLFVDEDQADFSGQLPDIDAQMAGPDDRLVADGAPDQANSITIGASALVINGTVVTYTGVDSATIGGGAMDGDVLSGQGGGAAGAPWTYGLEIIAGSGKSTLKGGNGPDDIYGDTGSRGDLINGEKGNDLIYGSNGNDNISGGPGNDTLQGEGGNDRLRGMMGDDQLTGGPGKDTLLGGGNDDQLYAQDGEKDIVNGGPNGQAGDSAYYDCSIDKVVKIENASCS